MTINFKSAETQANAILRADRAKLTWAKMPFADMPKDIQSLAITAVEAELVARSAKAALQSALDDKVVAPTGKRLIVTLGRDVSVNTDSVLVAWANASAPSTRTMTFDQFLKSNA
jgi:hypothetical protein